MRRALPHAGFAVDTAEDGAEGLAPAQRRKIGAEFIRTRHGLGYVLEAA